MHTPLITSNRAYRSLLRDRRSHAAARLGGLPRDADDVELDHCVEGDEYEEVIAFYTPDNQLRRWILWRSATDIVVQPLIGRSIHFGTVADAIETLVPDPCLAGAVSSDTTH